VNDELGSMWKEAIVAQSRVLFRNFPEWTEKNEKNSVRQPVSGPRYQPRTSLIWPPEPRHNVWFRIVT